MSGIFGFAGPPDHTLLGRMAAVLLHRGPDDGGALERDAVSLGQRRLAVNGRTGGHQPLANEDESVWLVCDGEVYNHRELRAELEALGHVFATQADAEVVVHAYEEWGDTGAARFNGMWAYAIADFRPGAVGGETGATAGGRLVLCRDHFGIKPLYYTRSPVSGSLLFASEIKALLQDPSVTARPDEQVVFEYLLHGVHDHRGDTFFAGVFRVPAASTVVVELGGDRVAARGQREGGGEATGDAAGRLPTAAYWKPRLATDGDSDPAVFRRALRDAVERRLPAEVPVGSALSGGVDSTAIAVLMSELLKEGAPAAASLGDRLETFSAVPDGGSAVQDAFVELAAASTDAAHTGTHPTSAEFFGELRDVVWHQEEPVGSLAPYARWCAIRSAREDITVLLVGQGGCELLAGDAAHQVVYLRQLRREGKRAALRHEAAAGRDVLATDVRRRVAGRRKRFAIESVLRPGYRARVTDPGDGRSQNDLKLRLLQDLLQYSLPGRLRGEDRSAMAFSVESRLPYLDQELVERVLALPSDALVRDGWGRWILREGLRGTLPEKIRRRRRDVGATTPETRWIKARRAQFTGLYQSPSFMVRPFWRGEDVVEAFRRCCEGKVEDSWFFWRAINVESWLREYCDRPVVVEGVDEAAALSAPAPAGVVPRGAVAAPGDALAPRLVGDAARPEAERVLTAYAPNATKHLFACVRGRVYARLPVKTDLVGRGDDLEELFRRQVLPHVRPGDLVAIAEKPVATSQGRSYALDDIEPGRLARVLSKAVTRTPHGIGLGIPETMQLAIDEAGAPRILAATTAAAAGRLVRKRGWFYAIAGPAVESIDGPTPYTLPPHNTHAKLGPAEPDAVAERLSRALCDGLRAGQGADAASARTPSLVAREEREELAARPCRHALVEVAVVDVSDLDARVLGASAGADRALVSRLMLDNPLGQGHEQTPVCVLRDLGPLAPPRG